MKSIAVNGQKLHEIQMLTVPYNTGTVSYLRYPKYRIQFTLEGDRLFLKMPSFLTLELYRRGILPQNQKESVTIHISGRKVGTFVVVDFRYPNSVAQGHDMISMTLQK